MILSLLATTLIAPTGAIGATVGRMTSTNIDAVQKGLFAYVAPADKKIVEIDETGELKWEFSIPESVIGNGRIHAASDVEWIPKTDTYLFVIPGSGVFEVNRAKQIVWQYRTKFISHDADKLPNGNVIFVNGWDYANEPIVTEVTQSGDVVKELRLKDFPLNPSDSSMQEKNFAHTNSVRLFEDGSMLVSFRNFHTVLLMKDGKEVRHWKNISNVHDPELRPEGLIACNHGDSSKKKQFIELLTEDGKRTEVATVRERSLAPLRSCTVLPNGNYLATGSTAILQFLPTGELVWRLDLDGYLHQRDSKGNQNFLYKASFVRPH
jgi:WD40 repeat protein